MAQSSPRPLRHIVFHHWAFLHGWRLGYQFMSATVDLLYRKSLRISRQAMASVTTGHVINLISNDTER